MRHTLQQHAPVALGAALLAFAFPLFHWWYFAWFALAPLLVRAAADTPRAAAARFFFAGWIFHSLVLQWLVANVMWAGGWAILGYQGLCIALALFWAPVGFGWRWAAPRLPAPVAPLLLAALWGIMEWAQASLFTGFGWSALGYSQGPSLAFAQLAAVGGVSLLSVVLVLVNAFLAQAWLAPRRPWLPAACAAALAALAHLAGAALLGEAPPRPDGFRVGISQSNFPIEMKYDPDYTVEMVRRAANESAALAAAEPVNLVVWPEAVVMEHFEAAEVLDTMQELCTASNVSLFSGSVRDGNGQGYNSSVLIGPGGQIEDHYDKVHLVPFGEYVPFAWLFPFMEAVVPANAARGEGHKVLRTGPVRFGPMICFEVLYNGIAEELHSRGAEFLTVVTNLAWFGRSAAVPQELEIARFRAIEVRLPLVHAANTGISGVFDPYGRLEHIHGYIRPDGAYQRLDPARFPPGATIMQRMAGAFDLPAPAQRPVHNGATKLAIGCAAVAALLLAAGKAGKEKTGENTYRNRGSGKDE